MTKINVKSWVTVVTNISIVGGLLLVGAQMKQDAYLQRLQMLSEESRGIVENERAMLGENAAAVWAKSLQSPHDLSLEERRIMDAYFYMAAERLRSIYLLAQEGIFEKEEWQYRVASEVGYYFGNPYGQAWWRNFSDSDPVYPQDLINVINERLNDRTEVTIQYFDGLLESLPELLDADSKSKLPQ